MTLRVQKRTAGVLRLLLITSLALLAICAMLLVWQGPATAARTQPGTAQCAAGVDLYGFSDALDKTTFRGTTVGGLSGITYDARRDVYYALVDNQGTTASRFYTLRLRTDGKKVRKPKVLDVTILKDEDGTPFTGADFDGGPRRRERTRGPDRRRPARLRRDGPGVHEPRRHQGRHSLRACHIRRSVHRAALR